MINQDLRLECLRLALKDFSENHERVIEIAEAFENFIVSGGQEPSSK